MSEQHERPLYAARGGCTSSPNTRNYLPHTVTLQKAAFIRGGAGKSLARPGRKQATATKLGIYSTHSPRSSIHFLARCSNFCKPLKKFRRLSVQPGLRSSNDLRIEPFISFSPGTGGSPTGPDPENRVGNQDTGSRGRAVSSGLHVPDEPGKCRARTRPLGDLPAVGVFPSKCPSIDHQR